jgi:hypothetical protein
MRSGSALGGPNVDLGLSCRPAAVSGRGRWAGGAGERRVVGYLGAAEPGSGATGSFASLTEPGTSSKDCRNHFGTPTGRSFTCSKNQSRRLHPFPEADPLPGAYRLHLPSDGLTIWYTITESPDGHVVIVVQYVKADT